MSLRRWRPTPDAPDDVPCRPPDCDAAAYHADNVRALRTESSRRIARRSNPIRHSCISQNLQDGRAPDWRLISNQKMAGNWVSAPAMSFPHRKKRHWCTDQRLVCMHDACHGFTFHGPLGYLHTIHGIVISRSRRVRTVADDAPAFCLKRFGSISRRACAVAAA